VNAIQEIYDRTLTDGGVTMDLLGNVPKTGFMVSEMGGIEVLLDEFSIRAIEHAVSENKNALSGTGAYIRTWIDIGTATVYVGYSVNFYDLEKALSVGRRNGQRAIYSLDTQRTIYL
jgi:hypothetical protein